jgi:DeoR/GlpR family transcriptional regulator of sugar metabolism
MGQKRMLRQDRLLNLLTAQTSHHVSDLAQALRVSGWTLRRDLEFLEQHGLIERHHGTAQLSAEGQRRTQRDRAIAPTSPELLEAKRRIAHLTAQLIPPGTRLALGAGSTTVEVAKALRGKSHLEVMTNSLEVALELSQIPGIKSICTGGDVDGDFSTLNGAITQRTLQAHFFDIAVISVSGLDLRGGLTVQSPMNAIALETMLHNADQLIVVADHSKFGAVGFARLAGLEDIDVIVTDQPIASQELRSKLERDAIQVIWSENLR